MSALHVKELERAYKKISTRACYFICDTLRKPEHEMIGNSLNDSNIWNPVTLEIKLSIDKALGGYSFSVRNWPVAQGIKTGDNYDDKMRTYHLEWIEHMIEY